MLTSQLLQLYNTKAYENGLRESILPTNPRRSDIIDAFIFYSGEENTWNIPVFQFIQIMSEFNNSFDISIYNRIVFNPRYVHLHNIRRNVYSIIKKVIINNDFPIQMYLVNCGYDSSTILNILGYSVYALKRYLCELPTFQNVFITKKKKIIPVINRIQSCLMNYEIINCKTFRSLEFMSHQNISTGNTNSVSVNNFRVQRESLINSNIIRNLLIPSSTIEDRTIPIEYIQQANTILLNTNTDNQTENQVTYVIQNPQTMINDNNMRFGPKFENKNKSQKKIQIKIIDESIEENDEVCPICIQKLYTLHINNNKIIKTIKCSHIFCYSCIDTWYKNNKITCPICRQSLV
ncbi:RING-finger-containing E3 ubiquitin ligase [Dasineura jujubifolia toursvirus 2a]|nr:RING-finger-containing E3 ubiquitin ligase [Dasineura jujubifolia toursvirus 2a]